MRIWRKDVGSYSLRQKRKGRQVWLTVAPPFGLHSVERGAVCLAEQLTLMLHKMSVFPVKITFLTNKTETCETGIMQNVPCSWIVYKFFYIHKLKEQPCQILWGSRLHLACLGRYMAVAILECKVVATRGRIQLATCTFKSKDVTITQLF
jgi:hypothetical protein